ncbi:MAG: YhcH/YjgK/YiaL family protein [Oscillospiraceae bacterium]
MIFGSANAVGCPYQYPAAIETALKWIANHDMAHMEAGTYEVQGKDLYIMIQDITTQDAEIRRPERHNDYLDIQYIVSGVERMGYVPYTGTESVLEAPEGKDVIFYKDLEGENFVDVAPGCYCIFFSDDIHRPGCAAGEPGNVRKAVAKVKQSLL